VEVLALYFDEMRLIFEAHGGTIEKIIGDAIFAVFGLVEAPEDHALRAVAAAAECQTALSALNEQLDRRWGVRLVNRTGVAMGEVVIAPASSGGRVLIGDVVQLANKLEQSAPPMDVLVSESAYRSVADRVTVAAVHADGSQPGGTLSAYRLISVTPIPRAQESCARAAPTSDTKVCASCGMQNPAAFRRCGACGAQLVAKRSREARKTVTIVFADVRPAVGSAPPAPETLKDLMARVSEVAREAVERHGGTLAKFIGDAVMAVFGLHIRREDDALRAVRAATDMRGGLQKLGESVERESGLHLDVAIGVNTGEVAAGHASLGQSLVIGDAVNVAARLEQTAGANEILMGPLTSSLVRDFTEIEEIEPLVLKGKLQPVRAYRLRAIKSAARPRRRMQGAMLGRETEMTLLAQTLDSAMAHRACRMVTLIGDAGVGKTRLIEEFLGSIAERALVLRGRCLPYGEGITFWPIVGMVGDASDIQETDRPEAAREKIRVLIGNDEVADRVAAAVGLLEAPFQVAELFWGIRRFLEILAAQQPVAVLFDDIHWAEPTFLDLIERLTVQTEDAPVMLLCTARQGLLDKRPSWAEGSGASRVSLNPLSDADAARVIDNLLGQAGLSERVRMKVVGAAEGNPLFVEQLVSMLIDTGMLHFAAGRWEPTGDLNEISIPPTIHALLAARLDQLSDSERAVLEPASVIGLIFAQPAVVALVEDGIRDEVPARLAALEEREVVRRQAGDGVPEHRFAHLMIRDATYAGLLKRARAQLHERFVGWADEAYGATDRATEYEEILGYHLEQAHRYLSELGPLDDHGVSLGIEASSRLASAGRRAFERGDMPATANLLRRAAATLPPGHRARPQLEYRFGLALWETGDYPKATAALETAIAGAMALHDVGLETTARLALIMKQYYADPSKVEGPVERRIREAIRVLEDAGDEEGLAQAWLAMANVRIVDNQWGAAARAIERVMGHARKAGNRILEIRAAPTLAMCAQYGPARVDEAIALCEEIIARSGGDRRSEAIAYRGLAYLHAMRGDFDLAREEYQGARAMLEELGWTFIAALGSIVSGPVEMLAGDPAAAEQELRRDYETLDRLGDRNYISTVAGYLAEALYQQSRYEEAESFAGFCAEVAAPEDLATQVLWRGVSAKLLAHRGEVDDAERAAREAVEMIRGADDPIDLANALMDLSEVLRLARRDDEAAPVVTEALALYEQKGNLVAAENARKLIAEARHASKASRRAH
jgi:class 3 adenylate cyclase/tetratricopeptide (TPR) repeat protein